MKMFCLIPVVKKSVFVSLEVVREIHYVNFSAHLGAVAELVGIEVGVVSGVINLESSGVEASDWRPRHDEPYHEV